MRSAKPPLQVVREGNPGHRPVRMGVRLPPSELVEPDWFEVFPSPGPGDGGSPDEVLRCRDVARREWQRLVPMLRHVGLGAADEMVLLDLCVCRARLDQAERAISRDGALMQGERGWQKNGWTTIAAQYRTQLKAYVGELGLSPSARGRIDAPETAPGADATDLCL